MTFYKYYQHRYGGLYRFQCTAKSTVDKSDMIVYEHLYPFEPELWVRSAEEFYDGRFKEITYEEFYFIRETSPKEEFKETIIKARQLAKG
jgi:hypothetical protein